MWQYKVKILGPEDGHTFRDHLSILDALGKEGWELINILPQKGAAASIHGDSQICYFFKRWSVEIDDDA